MTRWSHEEKELVLNFRAQGKQYKQISDLVAEHGYDISPTQVGSILKDERAKNDKRAMPRNNAAYVAW